MPAKSCLNQFTLALLMLSSVASAEAESEALKAPALVKARAEATLSAVVAGVIDSLPFAEGAAFAKGELLVGLNCDIARAEHAAARAKYAEAEAEHRSRAALAKRGGIGATQVAIARAAAEAAAARSKAARLHLKGCEIRAPYDGHVADIRVNRHEYVQSAQPVLAIVSSQTPDIEIIAPALWLSRIAVDTSGSLALDATGRRYAIRVTGIARTVDPVSRTVKLTASFEQPGTEILPGMSGFASFEQ